MAQARLMALSGPLQGSEFRMLEPEFTIGREESCDLSLPEQTVSRRHCVIRREGTQFRLRDLGSVNLTEVNGKVALDTLLNHGDQILVGGSLLAFLFDDVPPADPAGDIIGAEATLVLRRDQVLYLRPDHALESARGSRQVASHIRTLLRAASAISSACDLEQLGRALMTTLADVIPAERGALVVADGSGVVVTWSRNGEINPSFQPPRSVVARVLDEGVAVCLSNILLATSGDYSASVKRARINSILAAPVGTEESRLGVLYLDALSPAVRLGENDLQLLAGIAGMAMMPLAAMLRVRRLEIENQRLELELRGEGGMIGDSPRMREVYQFIRRAAPTGSTVLINGESGTGKELVARAIHRNSPRAGRPFVAINCAAITETLLESEFFGHEKGAFTGAAAQKRGKLEEADGGTVFLDEIGELAPLLQAKLLRVLQEREFERVGGTRTIRIDIRVVAATNRDLPEMVRAGRFRQDLYYRLNVVSVILPSLRERREDIVPLSVHFLGKSREACARTVRGLSAEARACLTHYDWPGNVRELQNAIEHAVVLGSTEEILPEDLPDTIAQTGAGGENGGLPEPGGKFHQTIREMKRQLVLKAMEQTSQNYTEAARLLGLHPNNLHRLMKSLNLK